MQKFKLWQRARCKVTWFEWIITWSAQYLTWCDTYQLTPKVKDWKIQDGCQVDSNSLELIDDWVMEEFEPIKKKTATKWWPRKLFPKAY